MRLLVLALLEQFQLPPEHHDLPLLEAQRIAELTHGVLLEGQLGLHFCELPLEKLDITVRAVCHGLSFQACLFRLSQRANILPAHIEIHDDTMSKQKNSSLVYSTDGGRLCPQCHRPVAACVCGKDRPASLGDGIVRLQRETKGRGGKAVTIITGLGLAEPELKLLAKAMKQKCGVGGALKGENIEIQGDQRTILKIELENRGYTVKIAGG